MLRTRSRSAVAALGLLGAACMSGDDARQAVEAVRAEDPPDVLPVIRPELPLPFHYPEALVAQRVEADVVLRLFVDSLGRVLPESIAVATPSGFAALDSAARAGARALQFVPASRDSVPVGVSVMLPVQFRPPVAAPATAGAPDSASGG